MNKKKGSKKSFHLVEVVLAISIFLAVGIFVVGVPVKNLIQEKKELEEVSLQRGLSLFLMELETRYTTEDLLEKVDDQIQEKYEIVYAKKKKRCLISYTVTLKKMDANWKEFKVSIKDCPPGETKTTNYFFAVKRDPAKA